MFQLSITLSFTVNEVVSMTFNFCVYIHVRTTKFYELDKITHALQEVDIVPFKFMNIKYFDYTIELLDTKCLN